MLGWYHLKGLTQLQSLDLLWNQGDRRRAGAPQRVDPTPIAVTCSNTKVTDAGLEHLKGLTQLQSLDLSFAPR